MSSELLQYNQAPELYLHSLTSAWRRDRIRHGSHWHARDPEAAAKMLRNPTIAHAVNHRTSLAAGRDWALIPRNPSHPRAALAVAIGTELIGGIRKFTEARRKLARACFHGERYSLIHEALRPLAIGDGTVRNWYVPTRLEDQHGYRYQKIVDDPYAESPKAHWQRWEILGPHGGQWV
ncbi:MAG: hypothetical protein HKN46_10135, partial [Acidimicrobiia bacterium]|nr:hypothetical protein [Acidimicrobiia bacterium]